MLLIYHDVLDAEKCELLIREHETNPDKAILHQQDNIFDDRVLFLHRMTPPAQALAATVAIEIGKILGHHFKLPLYPETVSVVRWGPGDEMALHRDGGQPHTSNRTHSVVLYLNDQDEGGQIYFPEAGTVISPRRALMVAYEKTLLHGVCPVEAPRYTLTLWYSDKVEHGIIR